MRFRRKSSDEPEVAEPEVVQAETVQREVVQPDVPEPPVTEPPVTEPPPAPTWQPPAVEGNHDDAFAERPEVFVGAAFVGGFAIALLLKRIGR